eukprot:scaffold136104_cov25-Tisochrysis_lutea.AAC.5
MPGKGVHHMHHGHSQWGRPVEGAHEQEARAVEQGDRVHGLEGRQHVLVDDAVGVVHLKLKCKRRRKAAAEIQDSGF